MKKSYRVILQSLLATSGAAVNFKTYYYDWSQLKDCHYKLTFTYSSSVITLSTTQTAYLFVGLTQSYNNITSDQSGQITEYRGDYLGSLYHTRGQSFPYLSANQKSNPPIYLDGRPRANIFSVEIKANVNTAFPFGSANYTLILSFEEC